MFHLVVVVVVVVVAVVVLVLVPLKWRDNITERIERKFSLKIPCACIIFLTVQLICNTPVQGRAIFSKNFRSIRSVVVPLQRNKYKNNNAVRQVLSF